MFWDKECVSIVGITAAKLRGIMKEAGEDHPQIFHIHLDCLLEKKLAFRVKYTTFYKQCSIAMLNRDEHVYNMINEYMNPNEHTSNVALLETPATNPTSQNKHNLSPTTEVTLSETSSTNTPYKRDVAAITYDDPSTAMYLTPQNSENKVKHMKTE